MNALRTVCGCSVVVGLLALVPTQGMPDHRRDLSDLRNEYPAKITKAQAGELLARLAFKLKDQGFGVYRKDGGNRCPLPGATFSISCDIVLHKPTSTWCDVLGDAPDDQTPVNTAKASWCSGTPGDMTNFVAVTIDPRINNPPPPPPPPVADAVTHAELVAAMAALHAQVLDEVRALMPPPASGGVTEDRVTAIVRDVVARASVDGKTRTAFGHQHIVQLGLTVK